MLFVCLSLPLAFTGLAEDSWACFDFCQKRWRSKVITLRYAWGLVCIIACKCGCQHALPRAVGAFVSVCQKQELKIPKLQVKGSELTLKEIWIVRLSAAATRGSVGAGGGEAIFLGFSIVHIEPFVNQTCRGVADTSKLHSRVLKPRHSAIECGCLVSRSVII